MRKKVNVSCIVVGLIFLLSLSAAWASGGTYIFGPKKYDKPKGSPVTYTDNFAVVNPDGVYFLTIPKRELREYFEENATVTLNGQVVVDAGDMRKETGREVVKMVNLRPYNTLEVKLKGKAGKFLVLYIETPVRIDLTIKNGIVPLKTIISYNAPAGLGASPYSIDFEGDGIVDNTSDKDGQIEHVYPLVGIYNPTVKVRDKAGNVYSCSAVVEVFASPPLQERLDAMKGALARSDVEGALVYFAENSRPKYREAFTLLKDKLPAVAAGIGQINDIKVENNFAKAEITREQVIDGVSRKMLYEIIFYKDPSTGAWLIYSF